MPTATWPPELPQEQLLGLAHKPEPNVIRFQVDAGPDKVRRRSTKKKVVQTTPMEFTGAELAIFTVFFNETIRDGADEFTWKDAITDETIVFRFVKEPDWTLTIPAPDPDDRRYEATLELEQV